MDSRSQQPMINLSGSGRKRNKENQSDASLAVFLLAMDSQIIAGGQSHNIEF
uniref:Uncharacterized protein n=1 Tax=Daucus carota subsp. sativus TaxID=79200 RepID=A0A164TX54_DAUCS